MRVRLSQSLLGSSARASRENTNRSLRHLVTAGVPSIEDGVVHDREALARSARS